MEYSVDISEMGTEVYIGGGNSCTYFGRLYIDMEPNLPYVKCSTSILSSYDAFPAVPLTCLLFST